VRGIRLPSEVQNFFIGIFRSRTLACIGIERNISGKSLGYMKNFSYIILYKSNKGCKVSLIFYRHMFSIPELEI
jgi:hypothetical protein